MSSKRRFAFSLIPALIVLFAATLFLSAGAPAGTLKLELQLVWATNDEKSPDPKLQLAEEDISKKLKKGFKWKNYFEVRRKAVELNGAEPKKVEMSKKASLDIKNVGNGKIEVRFFGEGKEVDHRTEPLSNCPLIFGGIAENETGWFVVVKPGK
jgi:hypothetical protein